MRGRGMGPRVRRGWPIGAAVWALVLCATVAIPVVWLLRPGGSSGQLPELDQPPSASEAPDLAHRDPVDVVARDGSSGLREERGPATQRGSLVSAQASDWLAVPLSGQVTIAVDGVKQECLVDNGHWRVLASPFAALEVVSVVLDGGCFVPMDVVPRRSADGLFLVEGELWFDVGLEVVDSEAGSSLKGAQVLAAKGAWGGMANVAPHPAEMRDGGHRLESGSEYLACARVQLLGDGGVRGYWVWLEGYFPKRIDVDHRQGGRRRVALDRCASLRVTCRGEVKGRSLVCRLLLARAGALGESTVIAEFPLENAFVEADCLPPGEFLLEVVEPNDYLSGYRCSSASVLLEHGRVSSVDLQLCSPPPLEGIAIHGFISGEGLPSVQGRWMEFAWIGEGEAVRSVTPLFVGAESGASQFSYSLALPGPGEYRVRIPGLLWSRTLVLTGGRCDFQLPQVRWVEIEMYDVSTLEPVDGFVWVASAPKRVSPLDFPPRDDHVWMDVEYSASVWRVGVAGPLSFYGAWAPGYRAAVGQLEYSSSDDSPVLRVGLRSPTGVRMQLTSDGVGVPVTPYLEWELQDEGGAAARGRLRESGLLEVAAGGDFSLLLGREEGRTGFLRAAVSIPDGGVVECVIDLGD